MTSTLRAPAAASPTSSASSQTTTPTSPHFITHTSHSHHPQSSLGRFAAAHPYATGGMYAHDARSASSLSISHPRPATPPLLQPPPGRSFTTYLRSWGDTEIASFLSLHRCGQYASAFQKNDITGNVLLDLDMNALKEIGVVKVGERVKLLGGIKDLRKRAYARSVPNLNASSSTIDLRVNGRSTPLQDGGAKGEGSEDGAGRSRRVQSRPPPLDILPHVGGRPLPQAYQNPVPAVTSATSAGSASLTPKPRPSHSTSSSTTITPATLSSSLSSAQAPTRSASNNATLRAPPARDVLRRTPSPGNGSVSNPDLSNFLDRPLPPAPSSRSQAQSSAAQYASSITQQRHANHSPGESIGLPSNPAPGRSASQLAAVKSEHRRYPSLGTPTKQTSPIKSRSSNGRPGTSTGASASTAGSSHPFAASSRNTSNQHPTLSRSASSDVRQPTTQLPLEDLRRQIVKFINAEDGTSRAVAVAECTSGVEVLERVLKKFGKWNTGTSISTDGDSDEDGDRLEVDGWGVYAESEPDEDAKPLSEASLLAICLANRDGIAVREKGLVIRRNTKHAHHRKNMEEFFGETPPAPMSPTSPNYVPGPRFGVGEDPSMLTPSKQPSSKKKMNRASTVSVMSGLGVPLPDGATPPSPSTARTPSGSTFLGIRRKPLYNFFGHRPPSELIANHLGEYFPAAKKKELEKSRNSMMRLSMGPKRQSVLAGLANNQTVESLPGSKRQSSESDRRSHASTPKRKSYHPSSRSNVASPPTAAIPEEGEATEVDAVPRVSVSNDSGRVSRPKIDGESDSGASVASRPPLLPPFEPSKESLEDSLKAYSPLPKPRPISIIQGRRGSASSAKSRVSMMSQLRRNRDRSDNASLLTVDEITAEVEQRRASTITFDESSGDEAMDVPPGIPPGIVPQDEVDEGSDADDEEYEYESSEEESSSDEEEEEEEEEEELEDEQGKAFTSTGSRIFKWIKGALIGAGSFGSVYLGMDAQSGLLMAVKQVALPTGSEKNEEHKRNMVVALEREIELLKELQHENIVQYLDSSADGAYLNIFLEYVPGGSVAALLNNYGAFEEALVRNFCRQILTGLNYLHERDIIHRDIKGANILVDNKGGIKISDFGISKKVENHGLLDPSAIRAAHRPSLQGSVFWMAPEVVKQTSYTRAADIWSVGCLVVEMLTGTRPWADLSQIQAMFRIGQVDRPANPSDISPEAADFLDKTFEFDHRKRPTAAELLEHPFITPKNGQSSMISAAQARQAMAQATKARDNMMGGMQSLSALAEARG